MSLGCPVLLHPHLGVCLFGMRGCREEGVGGLVGGEGKLFWWWPMNNIQ